MFSGHRYFFYIMYTRNFEDMILRAENLVKVYRQRAVVNSSQCWIYIFGYPKHHADAHVQKGAKWDWVSGPGSLCFQEPLSRGQYQSRIGDGDKHD